jgi:hypothetical protein
MEPSRRQVGAPPLHKPRTVVVGQASVERAALAFAVDNLVGPGDALVLVHVARVAPPSTVVLHSAPHSTFTSGAGGPGGDGDEIADLYNTVSKAVRRRCAPQQWAPGRGLWAGTCCSQAALISRVAWPRPPVVGPLLPACHWQWAGGHGALGLLLVPWIGDATLPRTQTQGAVICRGAGRAGRARGQWWRVAGSGVVLSRGGGQSGAAPRRRGPRNVLQAWARIGGQLKAPRLPVVI